MFDINGTASTASPVRNERGERWHRKGNIWSFIAGGLFLAGVVMSAISLLAPGSQQALSIAAWLVYAPAAAAVVRANVWYRRARRIWAGVR